MVKRALSALFHGPAWLTFIAMGVATAGFTLSWVNLFEMFSANLRVVGAYGLMALFDGGLLQFLELAGWGYLGLAFYVVFKGCLDGLLQRVPAQYGARRAEKRSHERVSKGGS
jgi:hypothetical protein